ncbi:MAG TPA: amidohydrolase family protein [Chthonomonadaceae bacterium]|nr:amidohydrolase family protein [Chthonomonadaceae bacterium]
MQVCGKLCETGEVVTLTLADGRIAGIRSGADPEALGGPDVWLSAGFFDIQVNGYGGHDFNVGIWESSEQAGQEFTALFQALARAGTALLCPTIVTNSFAAMQTALKALSSALEADPSWARAVPGLHVEGPYLSSVDGPRGAHPLEHTRDPSWDEFQRFQEAADGRIKLFTLAPERDGALAFIEKLVASGVTVALGHTAAEPQTIRDAVSAGARMSTHLGNGAHSQIKRHPNYIWEQLAHDELYASIIADGHHLPASVVKAFARVKGPERLALVSDAVALGGLPPGIYSDGQHEVLPSGKIVLAGTPYLAGAGHLMDTCLANMLRFSDFTVAQAARSASAIPARILGLGAHKGRLQVGYDADITLFRTTETGPLEIVGTLCGGEVMYAK